MSTSAPVFLPNATSQMIMKLIFSYLNKKRKPWNLISQEWMLDSLKDWYGLEISRSALNYNLAILRKEGIIESVTRHWRDPVTGQFEPRVTLYKMTGKLKRYFQQVATWFRRCGWVADVKRLKGGACEVVGVATTPEACRTHYEEESRRKKHRQKRRGT